MQQPLSSLTYNGSISEAITEAKKQKKLFVVYISGENAESMKLEDSTWTDINVSESLSKYCILLHIQEGSSDAVNFSAIYPQNSAPSITAIGYNGLQVWRSEGFVSAEVLASSLEKAWFSLHIQETTATVLTAALVSNKSEPSDPGVSGIVPSGQRSSSDAALPSFLSETPAQSSEIEVSVKSDVTDENKAPKHAESTQPHQRTSPESFSASKSSSPANEQTTSYAEAAKKLDSNVDEELTSHIKEDKGLVDPVMIDSAHSISGRTYINARDGGINLDKNVDHHSSVPERDSCVVADKAINEVQYENAGVDNKAVDTDVHLNIRLPDGGSLQEKFPLASILAMVKDYVDRNQASGLGAYDFAIPYPRKVFSDEDLEKSLSDLGLLGRQALIVVPRHRATGYDRQRSSFSEQERSKAKTDSTNGSAGGYFGYVRKVLSYVNPFSYLGGGASSSSSGQESQTGMWQYGPNSTPRNNLPEGERPYMPYSPNQSTLTGRNDSRSSKRPSTSSFGSGSNIHTLKHDEDDTRFGDRNTFWNGNSTQYGGDNDGK